MLLAAANANRDNIPVKKRSGIICRCTYRALEQSNSPLAIKLLSWHMQHLGKLFNAYCNSLVEYAVSINDLAVVQLMQTSRYLDAKKYLHTQDIIKGVLKNRHLKQFSNTSRPMICCVPFAEAAFAVATYSLDTKQGLREAISQDNLPMVELFLKNGADPEGVESWRRDPEFHRGTCELARPGFKVYKIVREAVAKKVRRLKGTYEPLRFWVWDVKRQMDVPVAYTFHAPEL